MREHRKRRAFEFATDNDISNYESKIIEQERLPQERLPAEKVLGALVRA